MPHCVMSCIVNCLCWSHAHRHQQAKPISLGGLESWHEKIFEGAPTIKNCIVCFWSYYNLHWMGLLVIRHHGCDVIIPRYFIFGIFQFSHCLLFLLCFSPFPLPRFARIKKSPSKICKKYQKTVLLPCRQGHVVTHLACENLHLWCVGRSTNE